MNGRVSRTDTTAPFISSSIILSRALEETPSRLSQCSRRPRCAAGPLTTRAPRRARASAWCSELVFSFVSKRHLGRSGTRTRSRLSSKSCRSSTVLSVICAHSGCDSEANFRLLPHIHVSRAMDEEICFLTLHSSLAGQAGGAGGRGRRNDLAPCFLGKAAQVGVRIPKSVQIKCTSGHARVQPVSRVGVFTKMFNKRCCWSRCCCTRPCREPCRELTACCLPWSGAPQFAPRRPPPGPAPRWSAQA